MLIRVVDLGSNSIKASLYEAAQGDYRQVSKDKLDYALGDTVFSDGEVPDSGVDKVAAFINRLPIAHDGEKIHFTFAVATSALRSAKNRDEALAKLNQKTGLDIRILSGSEESYLIHTGIVHRAGARADQVVKTIDIGGGSAEVSASQGGQFLFGRSYELGAIRLTRRFLSKPLQTETLHELETHVAATLNPRGELSHDIETLVADRAIGSSGNVRALAKMVREIRGPSVANLLPDITPGSLEDIIELCLGRTPGQIKTLFELPLERARIVTAAAVVLLTCMRRFAIRRLEITEAGLREGVMHFWSRHGHLRLPLLDEESSLASQSKNRKTRA
jgi:exopolyphosphatase / guanosine-5'-triphosphate,3'-diphosphate pyrophosphatase